MILPKFLYNNVLRGITPTWSGTTVTGKEPANSIDWRDFSYFSADSGNLDFTMTTNTDIDTLSVYVATFTGTGAETIELQYEDSPASFTSLQTVNPAGGKLTFDEFSGVTVTSGLKIRFVITTGTGTLLIRQLVVGEVLTAETGQFASMTYPNLTGGVKVSNVIATNGSIIGRSIKRLERTGMLDLDLLTATWYRANWETFAQHAARYPFIYQPDSTNYASEVAFSAVEGGIPSPKNMGKGDRMAISWKLRNLVADELAF